MIFSTFKPNGANVEVNFFSIIDDENRNAGLQLIKQLQHDGNDLLKIPEFTFTKLSKNLWTSELLSAVVTELLCGSFKKWLLLVYHLEDALLVVSLLEQETILQDAWDGEV